jgi:hypothetical protein
MPNGEPETLILFIGGESVYIYLIIDALLEVALVLKKAVVDEFDIVGYANEAKEAVQEYMEAGEEEMQKMAAAAKDIRMRVNIDLYAPKIYIPYD